MRVGIPKGCDEVERKPFLLQSLQTESIAHELSDAGPRMKVANCGSLELLSVHQTLAGSQSKTLIGTPGISIITPGVEASGCSSNSKQHGRVSESEDSSSESQPPLVSQQPDCSKWSLRKLLKQTRTDPPTAGDETPTIKSISTATTLLKTHHRIADNPFGNPILRSLSRLVILTENSKFNDYIRS